MTHKIISSSKNSVSFEVTAQCYKDGRFTMPAAVLEQLKLDWNAPLHLRFESANDGQILWEGNHHMVSGPEIDSSQFKAFVKAGGVVYLTASNIH